MFDPSAAAFDAATKRLSGITEESPRSSLDGGSSSVAASGEHLDSAGMTLRGSSERVVAAPSTAAAGQRLITHGKHGKFSYIITLVFLWRMQYSHGDSAVVKIPDSQSGNTGPIPGASTSHQTVHPCAQLATTVETTRWLYDAHPVGGG